MSAGDGLIQSVERAAAILRLLGAENEPVPLAQIAGSLGLAKATAHGLLRTLVDVGFVDRDEGSRRYRLSSDLLQLGSYSVDLNELRTSTLTWVDTLAARTGEGASIAAFRDGRAVVANHVLGSSSNVGSVSNRQTLALHASALGKVLLAFDPGAARSIMGTPLDSLTFRTITDRAQLQRQLAETRDSGVAICMEEVEPRAVEIAAPVRDSGGYVIAAVGIDGPMERICDSRLRPHPQLVDDVVEVAHSISRVLRARTRR